MRLTERDKQIFLMIYLLGGVISLKQIDRLFFSGKGRSQPRQRMWTLFANAFVQRPNARTIHMVPLGESVYWLDEKGAEVVAAMLGVRLAELNWRRRPRFSWLKHDLAVNDFYIAVRQACETVPALALEQWVPETDFLVHPDTIHYVDEDGVEQERQVRPDGFLLITRERPGRQKRQAFAFLLEVDMATHSNPRFRREKGRAGGAYLASAAYERRFGLKFGRWLVVTTSDERMENLMRETEKVAEDGFFYFTTFDRVAAAESAAEAGVLFERYWRVAGSRELTSLIPDAKVS